MAVIGQVRHGQFTAPPHFLGDLGFEHAAVAVETDQVAGARVDIASTQGALERTTLTASDGTFAFAAVPGDVVVSVARPDATEEVALSGGRLTAGVVRVGGTVRRPTGPHSPFVHELLAHLEAVGFAGAPRLLGVDDQVILAWLQAEIESAPFQSYLIGDPPKPSHLARGLSLARNPNLDDAEQNADDNA